MGLGELEAGDTLLSRYGLVTVAQVTSHPAAPVYNISVQQQHVYEVTEWGIVVHNNPLAQELCDLRKKQAILQAEGKDLNAKDKKRLAKLEEMYEKGEIGDPSSNGQDSTKLRAALEEAGRACEEFEDAAHIVASHHPLHIRAREILRRAGIDINDEINGGGLPRNTKVPNPHGKTTHNVTHREEKLKKVTAMLIKAEKLGKVRETLRAIERQRQKGTF